MGLSMRQWKMGATFVGLIASCTLTYQNCAKVQVNDLSSQSSNNPLDIPQMPSEFSKVTVGISELADLKMLFVVDNSYTMKQNNINLATSFQTLFNAQNSDNLSLFPVTSYLLTVGQKTPAATLTDQARLETLRTWQVSNVGLTSAQLSSVRQASQLGKLAGDSVGYSVAKTGSSYAFEPAMVMGLDAGGNVVNSISKTKSESASKLVQDFKDRMSLLQNMNITNYEANKDILDHESGLCAVARVLRSSSYVKAGDLAVLNVFTDENDADIDGKNCLAGYTYSEGNEDLVDGGCETHKTTFNYKINVAKAAECSFQYNNTADWKLTYTEKQTSWKVEYYKTTGTNTCPETQYNYQAVTAWKKKRTKVTLTYNTYKILDGVKVVDPTAKARDIWMDGYKSAAECTSTAKANVSSGSEVYVSDVCATSDEPVGSCSLTDPNCLIATQAARSTKYAGNYTDAAGCASQTKALDSAMIPGTEKCILTGATVTSPYYMAGCQQNISASRYSTTGVTEDLSTQTACDNKAKALGGYVNANYTAVCTSSVADVAKTKTGSVALSSYPSITAVGDCPADLKTNVITSSGVNSANVTACSVTAIPNRTTVQALSVASCDLQASNYCAANPTFKNCILKSTTPAGTVQQAASLKADEDLQCTSLCSQSQTDFCKPNANLPSVNPSMTIADYLTQAQKSVVACGSSIAAVTPDISKFNGRKKADLASLCPAKTGTGLPVYARVDKTYRFKGFAPDYIAGNYLPDGGTLQPKTDLPTYITQRAAEIFGGQKPIVNVFIRTQNDPLGDAGSRGIAYETLAASLNAQVYSVLSADYSAALKDLSGVIKSKMLRTFKVPNMAAQRKVVAVVLKPQAGAVQKLTAAQWIQSGSSVQIHDSVALTVGDEIEFEYQ